jgi:hypothetical protein
MFVFIKSGKITLDRQFPLCYTAIMYRIKGACIVDPQQVIEFTKVCDADCPLVLGYILSTK